MKKNYDYIIVGAGHCGLLLAKDLTKKGRKVLVLEKGGFLNHIGSVYNAFFFYEGHALSYSKQGVIVYRVNGVGGTGVVGCGNAVAPSNEEILRTGIDFTGEIPDAKRETFTRDEGLTIGRASRRIMDEANSLGYDMMPMPKFSISGKCAACGNCYFGCNYDSKWNARYCLNDMDKNNYDLITGFGVHKIIIESGKAVGVEGRGRRFYAPKIILSAGGINTPVILQKSGITAGDNLFVDLFNVTYGVNKGYNQREELSMATVCPKFHLSDGFVMAPFVDNWFSFTSSAPVKYMPMFPMMNRLMGIMSKINDDPVGKVYENGNVDKGVTENDKKKLEKGSGIAREILTKCGCDPKSIFVTRPNGAHPGGTAAIGRVVDTNLEVRAAKNLYVCDASALPFAPGLPPMLMLAALAKWFAKRLS